MTFLGDDKSLVYELILALVSLWLLVNSIKKEKSQRKTSDWFFDYFTKRYFFYYIIILPLFGFKRGYGVKDRSDFILTEFKRCFFYYYIIFYLFLISNVVTARPNGRNLFYFLLGEKMT